MSRRSAIIGTSTAFAAGVVLALTGSTALAQMPSMSMRPNMSTMQRPMNPMMMMNHQPVVKVTINQHDHIHHHPWWWWSYNPWIWAASYGGYGSYGSYGSPYMYPLSEDYPPSYSTRKNYDTPAEKPSPAPSPETQDRRAEQTSLERALNTPAVNEITSGKTLNVILKDLQKAVAERGWSELPSSSLDMPADLLGRINVTRSEGSNIGMLKQWDRMTWPAALSGSEFKPQRKQLDNLTKTAIAQAKSDGRVDPEIIRQLDDSVSSMQQRLRDKTVNLSFDVHQEAKTFLNNLQAGIGALRQPDVKFLINGEYHIKAQTVPELVKWMSDKGVKFAPAMPGDEAAYTTLQERLSTYDRSLRGVANSNQPSPGYKVVP
jgi:hypothetical protein